MTSRSMPLGRSGVARRRWNASASSAVISLTVVKTSASRAVTPSSECLATMPTSRAACSGRSSLEAGERQLARRRQRASEHRRVRGEHRADRGRVLLEVEQRRARHPLVRELTTAGLPAGATRSRHQRSITMPGGVAEQHRLDVVPAAGERVDLVVLPQLGEDSVLRRRAGRRTRPGSPAAARGCASVRRAPARRVARQPRRTRRSSGSSSKLPSTFCCDEQPRADRDVVVAEALDQRLGLGRDDGVDAADLVADLPADLEQDERGRTVSVPGARSSWSVWRWQRALAAGVAGAKRARLYPATGAAAIGTGSAQVSWLSLFT